MASKITVSIRAPKAALEKLEQRSGKGNRSQMLRALIHKVNTNPNALMDILRFRVRDLYKGA